MPPKLYINLLEYRISKPILQLNPGGVKQVLDMPVPRNAQELQCILGCSPVMRNGSLIILRVKPLIVSKKFS